MLFQGLRSLVKNFATLVCQFYELETSILMERYRWHRVNLYRKFTIIRTTATTLKLARW